MMITHLSLLAKIFLRRMPFLPQPSPFIQAWDQHQETQKSASDGWVRCSEGAVKEDMREVGVKETDVEDRKMWRMMIRCGHP